MMIKTYQEALDFLYSFVDYSLTRNLRYSPDKFNLDRMKQLMKDLGNPQESYPIIHVAGTKGKGSTCAMITSILTEAGYKVGFYSSPHMIEFTERIKIGSEEISQEKIVKLVNKVEKVVLDSGNLTTFEITTALAFLHYQHEKVDVAVIEVGMGGRLDATNVVNPEISVITSISHDHTKFLGNTLEKIAKEKAGIIKPGKPVVIAPQKERARQTLTKAAIEKKAIPVCVESAYDYAVTHHGYFGQKIMIWKKKQIEELSSSRSSPVEIEIPLMGQHQAENAVTAKCVIDELNKSHIVTSQEAVQKGFKNVYWPGRFELIDQQPVMIIDSAHNPDSFRKLKITISDYLPDQRINLMFAASEDKDISKMLEIIQPKVDQLFLTKTQHPRAAEIIELVKIAEELGYENISSGEFEEMIECSRNNTEKNQVLIAAGSIFLAGAVHEYFAKEKEISKEE